MGRLRLGCPIWLDQPRSPEPPSSVLRCDVSADVVIVGGGLTGAVIAHECVSRGLSTVVLDSGRVGHGSTSANTGLLVYEPDKPLGSIGARYGLEKALRIWHRSREASETFAGTVRRLRIDCGLARRASIYAATTPAAARRLRCEHHLRQAEGIRGDWLDAETLRRHVAVRGTGAIETHGHAQLDPYCACLGFLTAATDAGARLFTQSRVRRVDTTARGVHVRTSRGSVRARQVVIATGYATRDFRPIARAYALMHTYVLCTPPLSRNERAQVGLPDLLLWSSERAYSYVRWGSGHRLIAGGADRPLVPEARRTAAFVQGRRRLARNLRALLPGLVGIPFERAWEGLFAVTPDGLPYIGPHPRYPHHLFALGYGGNGMVYAWLAAQMLTRSMTGRPDPDLKLFSFDRLRREQA